MRLSALLLGLVLGAGLAYGAAGDTSKRAKIESLLEITQVEPGIERIVPLFVDQAFDHLRQRHPEVSKEVLIIIRDEVMAVALDMAPAMIDDFVPLYEETFTETEIDAMLAFYETEAGRSIVRKSVSVSEAGMVIAQDWGRQVATIALDRIFVRLREQGFDL